MDDATWQSLLIHGMDGWFDGDAQPFANDYICIEGTYRIVTSHLTTIQDNALLEIYKKLPGRCRVNATDSMPYWFGEDRNDVPYLTASFEPGGILIEGILQKADWVEWDTMFRRLVEEAGLPRYPA